MSTAPDKTPGQQFFDEHMRYIGEGDMARMVRDQYTEDAILYNAFPFLDTPPPNVIRGQENLVPAFAAYLGYQGAIEDVTVYNFLETEDVISFQATFTSPKTGKWAVGDTWLMRDGKIARHFGFAHKLPD